MYVSNEKKTLRNLPLNFYHVKKEFGKKFVKQKERIT